MHLEQRFPCVHLRVDITKYYEGVTEVTYPGPYVYRVLIPYLIKGIHIIVPVLSIVNIDLTIKIIILIFCQTVFYYYLTIFFSPIFSLAGVFYLDILLSFTFSSIPGPSILETVQEESIHCGFCRKKWYILGDLTN